jgi:hypothetical protein
LSKSSAGFFEDKFLQMRVVARAVGKEDEYLAMNKVCSKWVHPTSLSVLAIKREGEEQAFRERLLLTGAKYLSELVADMVPFVASLIEK